MTRQRRFVRWAVRLAIATVVLAGAAVLVAPRLLDVPAVQARLEQWVSRAARGDVTWEHLEVRLFPAPHGMMRGARIDIPGALTATIERVELELRLWPLLRGHVEIGSVSVLRPVLRIQLPPPRQQSAGVTDPFLAHAAALRPAMDAVQRLLPDASLTLEGARVEIAAPQLPRIGVLAIDARAATDAEGVNIDATVNGEHWDRLKLATRIASADLRANATLEAAGVKLQEALGADHALVLPPANARLEARTDGQGSLQAAFKVELPSAALRRGGRRLEMGDVALEGTVKLIAGEMALALSDFRLGDLVPSGRATLRLAGPQHAPEASLQIAALEVARLRDAVLALAGDQPAVRDYVARVGGGRVSDLQVGAKSDTLKTLLLLPNLHGRLKLSGGGMRLPVIDKPARGIGALVELAGSTLKVRDITGRVGNSVLTRGNVDIALAAPRRLDASGGQATLAIDELVAWLRTREPLADALKSVRSVSGGAEVTLHELQWRFDRPEALAYDVTVRPRQVRADLAELPMASIDGGTLRLTPDTLTLERVGAAALDASALLSGTIGDYRTGRRRVDARVDDALAGSELVAWVWQRAGLPPRARPATPLQLSAPRVQWSDAGFDATVRARFPAGLEADAEFGLRGKVLDLRRLALKDRESDAVLRLAQRGPLLDAGFTGVLTGASLASMLAEAPAAISGGVEGDLQVSYDTERPGRTTGKGSLSAEGLDLGVLLPVPIKLERADLRVDGRTLRMHEVTLDWSGQRATLRGEIAQRESGLVVQAEVESPGVTLDALLPPAQPQGEEETVQREVSALSRLWPLPLTGTVALRAGFVQSRGLRVEPLRATLALEAQRAHLKVAEAALCGIAFPFTLSAAPGGVEAALRLAAKDQELESVAHCLSGQQLQITGRFDLAAELAARGGLADLARAAEGSVKFHARGGEIRKFALVGNILSLTNVRSVLENEVDLGSDAFRYRDIHVQGRIGRERFNIDEGSLHSDALGLAATGEIGFDFQSVLTVLVAPFSRLDQAVRGVPILGYVIGGTFTSIPVGVSGDIRDPLVVPLGPRAITSELLGIFERTLRLPAKLVAPLGAQPAEK